jgi:thiamine-monophosphate kinase
LEKSEFEFIETIRRRYSLTKIGDDCAVLPKDSKTDLVMTTDLLVEDIDFRLDWTTPEFLGHKALAVSLSDVAAMGAKPVWAMLSIGVPAHIWKTDFVEKLYEGWFRLAKKFNVELVGGDVSKTPDKIVIDSIAAGETKKGKAVLRTGAKVGDLIFISGELGGASGGLSLLESGVRYDSNDKCVRKNLLLEQLKPFPKISDGEFLRENNLANSMIDISDGLSGDLAHLCRASRVGAKVYAEKIPFHKDLSAAASSFDEKLEFALNGGEDYELLFTVDSKKYLQAKNEIIKRNFFYVGEITANAETIELVINKKSKILKPKSFQHF